MIKKSLIFIFLSLFALPATVPAGWQSPVFIDSTEYITYPQIEARNDSIYVMWDGYFIRSLDGGATWRDFCRLAVDGGIESDALKIEGDSITAILQSNMPPGPIERLYFSSDFGLTWQGPRQTWGYGSYANLSACRRGTSIYQAVIETYIDDRGEVLFVKSDDFGLTWPYPRTIHWYDQPGYPNIYKFFDKIFILSEVGYQGSLHLFTIQLLTSTDEGGSWTNRDSLTPPVSIWDLGMDASTDGRIAFVYDDWWPDDPGGEDSSRVYISVSSDSGSTWSSPIDISDTTFANRKPHLAMSGDTIAACWFSNRGFILRRSHDLGLTWQDVEIISANSGIGDIDWSNGKLHAVYLGAYNGGAGLFYRCWEPDEQAVGDGVLPTALSLSPNYPNPFNSHTTISFSLAKPGDVALEIFDILGRRVETLHQGRLAAGEYSVKWDAGEAPSGVYFYRLRAGDTEQTRRMLLVK